MGKPRKFIIGGKHKDDSISVFEINKDGQKYRYLGMDYYIELIEKSAADKLAEAAKIGHLFQSCTVGDNAGYDERCPLCKAIKDYRGE